VKYENNDEMWRNLLTGTDPGLVKFQNFMKRLPHGPRCKLCNAPFAGVGRVLVSPFGFRRWAANPALCKICARGLDQGLGGTEIESTFLFADIRGSTTIAERTTAAAYHALLERFYSVAGRAVDDAGGLVDKYLGDGVVAMFVPVFAKGREPALAAIEAARSILAETAKPHGSQPSIPVGVGVHSGPAYVGVLGTEGGQLDFTGVGDTVNIAARLSSAAAAGELLASAATVERAGIATAGLESRRLELKGREEPVDVFVLESIGATEAGAAA
jgi:adenylate cyclase